MRQSRVVPAVEYLQAQRVRAMIMRRFADTVSKYDVYVAPYIDMRSGAGRSGGSEGSGRSGRSEPPPPSAIRDHFQVANLCGYPAVSVPNGFTADGKPTSITFLGRLYNEADILAVARVYQERAKWIERRPALTS